MIDADRILEHADAILAERGLARTKMIDGQGRVCIRGAVCLAWAEEVGIDASAWIEQRDLAAFVQEVAWPWQRRHPEAHPVLRDVYARLDAAAAGDGDGDPFASADVLLNNDPATTVEDMRAVVARARAGEQP